VLQFCITRYTFIDFSLFAVEKYHAFVRKKYQNFEIISYIFIQNTTLTLLKIEALQN